MSKNRKEIALVKRDIAKCERNIEKLMGVYKKVRWFFESYYPSKAAGVPRLHITQTLADIEVRVTIEKEAIEDFQDELEELENE